MYFLRGLWLSQKSDGKCSEISPQDDVKRMQIVGASASMSEVVLTAELPILRKLHTTVIEMTIWCYRGVILNGIEYWNALTNERKYIIHSNIIFPQLFSCRFSFIHTYKPFYTINPVMNVPGNSWAANMWYQRWLEVTGQPRTTATRFAIECRRSLSDWSIYENKDAKVNKRYKWMMRK